jgi:6-pyruvoyltetrahydropterin/6-carboxytetrahydropterin synthase
VVREFAVPIFAERVRGAFQLGRHIGFGEIAETLKETGEVLADKLVGLQVSKLTLKLNPLRGVIMDSSEPNMIYYSEKFEFAAMHKLWNDKFTSERNFELFGKCANPSGHGHNYVVEVVVKKPVGKREFSVADFERVVDKEFVQIVDHKNLNVDVSEFQKINPTIENIAVFAWSRLAGKFGPATGGLHCVTVWESERTYCSYYG